jgi:uncharacterized membrane protein HdeD (DUF308 family)
MEERLDRRASKADRSWPPVLFTGIIAAAFGVLVLTWTGLTLDTLITFFGVFAIGYGVIYGFGAFFGVPMHRITGLLVGLAGIGAGIAALVWPDLTAETLLYIIAIWALASGVFDLVANFEGGRSALERGVYSLLGLVQIGFGLLFLVRPLGGALDYLWAIGVLTISLGFLRNSEAFAILYSHARRLAVRQVAGAAERVEVREPVTEPAPEYERQPAAYGTAAYPPIRESESGEYRPVAEYPPVQEREPVAEREPATTDEELPPEEEPRRVA